MKKNSGTAMRANSSVITYWKKLNAGNVSLSATGIPSKTT